MERRFDMSDFEQSLKDYADQFKIMPSKRVWNGIYNRLHPGSKWPSITVAIVFIITLVSIGNLNNSPKRFKKAAAVSSHSRNILADKGDKTVDIQAEKNKLPFDVGEKNQTDQSSAAVRKVTATNESITDNKTAFSNAEDKKDDDQNKIAKTTSVLANDNNRAGELQIESLLSKRPSIVNQQITSNLTFTEQNHFVLSTIETVFPEDDLLPKNGIQTDDPVRQFLISNREPISISFSNNTSTKAAEQSIESKEQQTKTVAKKALKKKKNNISWLYYIEPAMSYVSFHSKDLSSSNLSNPSSLVVLTNQSPFNLIRNPRPGFEAGIQAGFHITKKLQLISGFNLRYSAFSNVSNLVHPTFASLVLQDKTGNLYTKNFITHYGNGESQSQFPLVNYRFATSIPLGLQYTIWKNDKIELDISSIVEPSFVLKSNAYVISSDGRYYVNDPDLLRKMNIHGKFGSYISFYSKKIKWHIGPDIRYQFFSSYKDIYPTKEHFIDYGIRIGISR